MRSTVLGDVRTDGVLSYSMPQGDHRDPDVDLRDFTYDGRVTDHQLSGGLGQLTDGVEGHSNFRLDPDGWGRKGYEWVGWRNDSARLTTGVNSESSVVIVFDFEQARRFTAIRLHANNMFARDVRVFRRAVIGVGVAASELVSTSTPGLERVVYDHRRDRLIDFARNVVITLPDLVGSSVSVQLFFDATWMLVSEVRFESGALLRRVSAVKFDS